MILLLELAADLQDGEVKQQSQVDNQPSNAQDKQLESRGVVQRQEGDGCKNEQVGSGEDYTH